jgi:hypothetical protein
MNRYSRSYAAGEIDGVRGKAGEEISGITVL